MEATEESAVPSDGAPVEAGIEEAVIVDQPTSESLEDLLEFAFARRDQHHADRSVGRLPLNHAPVRRQCGVSDDSGRDCQYSAKSGAIMPGRPQD